MGISVEMFCKNYKANLKAKDKTFEDFINKHITTQYIDFVEKNVYCDKIIESCCYINNDDDDRKIIKINSTQRYLFFIMKLISLYTDIEFGDEIVTAYDELNKIGAINVLIAAIPESEYTEFSTILNMKMDDFRDNVYGITPMLYNFKESFSISDEIISSALELLQEQNKNE